MTIALVFLGPSGSGKSSVAKPAAARLGIPYIGSGDIARKLAELDSRTQAELNLGNWAPEEAMRMEIKAQTEAAAATAGAFIIEGFPRRISQLWILESIPGIRPLYFFLDLDPLLCMRRIILRNREDDNGDSYETRMTIYEEQTEPIHRMLADHLIWLDGNLASDDLVTMVCDEYQREAGR